MGPLTYIVVAAKKCHQEEGTPQNGQEQVNPSTQVAHEVLFVNRERDFYAFIVFVSNNFAFLFQFV